MSDTPASTFACPSDSRPSRIIVRTGSASSPPSFSATSPEVTTSGTAFVVCAVCGLTPSASSICSALPWSAVTRQIPPAACVASTTTPRHSSVTSTAVVTAGIEPVCPTMSGFAKLITAKQ